MVEPHSVNSASRSAVAAVVVGAALGYARPADAEGVPLAVALDYSAPEACSSPRAFWNALTERTQRVEPAPHDRAEILLRVTLSTTARGVVGRLQIVQRGFATEPRYVAADECKQVLEALALTAALGIDPNAMTEPPRDTPLAGEATSPPIYDPPDTDFPSLPSLPWSWNQVGEVSAVAAQPVDLRMSWGLNLGLSFNAERPGAWEPAFRAGLAYLDSSPWSNSDAAHFRLVSTTLQLCLLRATSEPITFRPCIASQLGMVIAKGQNLSDPAGTNRFWSTFGPALELEYDSPAGFGLQLELAAHFPLNPQIYRIGAPTSEVVARTSAVAPWIGFGVTYEL
jgi:hypothetical protein